MIVAGICAFLFSTASQAVVVQLGLSGSYIAFGSASRLNSLALGILMALVIDFLPKQLTGRLRVFLVAGGLAGWIGSYAWLPGELGVAVMPMVWVRLIVSLASAAILYGCLYSRSRLLTGSWVVQLGKISYGLYAFHFTGLVLAMSFCRPVSLWQKFAAKALGFVVTVVLASASYRWIESPFLRLKERFAAVPSRPV